MRWLLFALILLHGLIHFMGPAKAFGLAELPQLTQPVSRTMGVVWAASGATMLLSAAMLLASPRWWWVAGLAAVILSQAVVFTAWTDARFGTVANVLILLALLYGAASQGPWSFRAEYRRAVDEHLAGQHAATPPSVVTEAELAGLPAPVRAHLRVTGVVGRPRVRDFHATWRGRIRSGPDDPWMEFTAEQYNVLDEPARFFLMDARRGGLPVDVLHVYRGGTATMRVRLLSMIPLVNAGGPEMDRAETVTVLNDLTLLAPSALLDPAIRWEAVDARRALAWYTVGSETVRAELRFDDEGYLLDFVSDDRSAASADGATFVPMRWSTPVRDYRAFDGVRVVTHGEGRWHAPDGAYTYVELELTGLRVNVSGSGGETGSRP